MNAALCYLMLIFTKTKALAQQNAITAVCVCVYVCVFFMHWVAVVLRSIQYLSYGPHIAERAKLIPVCNPSSEIEVQAAAARSQRQ